MITLNTLRAICPATPASRLQLLVEPLNRAMEEFQINTPERQAPFLAQCAHESQGLLRLTENLNYSAAGLRGTWPTRFDDNEAAVYARQPERIANRVYANRMGNGSEASGDGWKYRGAGLIQTTGATNHLAVAIHFGLDPETVGAWLRTPEGAARSAGLFWSENGCNELADAGDFTAITRRINGGTNGLPERLALFDAAKLALA